jgi:hypothetical protein
MVNPALMTALGTLGAGFSAYGRAQQERDALKRAMEQQEFERGRLALADRRAIAQQNLENTRRTERDILDAILGGLRPAEQGVSIGGQTFGMPRTREDEIAERRRRFMVAYPNISEAQAELLARGEMRPGEILIDPGTARTGGKSTTTTGGKRTTTMTRPATQSLFSSRYSPFSGSGR